MIWFLLCGVALGITSCYVFTGAMRRHDAIRFASERRDLRKEIDRLRAQVALHINNGVKQ